MGELKPIGSEKLQGDEKLKRILELTYYQTPENSQKITNVIKETATGVYGVVKEKDGYYVKKGPSENSLDYIGGLFMKNKNKFSSYNEAYKKLEFLVEQEKLEEATKYVLKTNKAEPSLAPQEESPIPKPTGELPPPPGESAADFKGNAPVDSGGMEMPPENEMPDEEESSEPDENDYLKVIQKLSGKLQQKLMAYKDKLESKDIKAAIMQVLSGVDLQQQLDDSDREEILEKFEPEDETSDVENSAGEDLPTPPPENEMGEEENFNYDDDLDGIKSLEELISEPFEDENIEINELETGFEDYDDYSSDYDDEDVDADFINTLDSKEMRRARKYAKKDISREEDFDDDVEINELETGFEDYDDYSTDYDDEDVDADFINTFDSKEMKRAKKYAKNDISREEDFDYEDEPEGLTIKTAKPEETDEELDPTLISTNTEIDDNDVKELDLDELSNMINTGVKETLSKYFDE